MNVLDFVKFLSTHLAKKKNLVIITSVANGLAMVLLMYSLSVGLQGLAMEGGTSVRGLLLFICCCIAIYITQLIAIKTTSSAAYSALEGIELRLIDKLRRIDYSTFKAVSAPDIYAAIGGDKNAVIVAARMISTAISSFVLIAVVLIYLTTVSLTAVFLILLEFGVLVLIFYFYNKTLAKRIEADGQTVNDFSRSLRDIIDGFAELKMNNLKSEDLYTRNIKPAGDKKTESCKATEIYWVKMLVLSQAATFVPLGLVVFILPSLSTVDVQSVLEIMTIVLVITSPAGLLANFISNSGMAYSTLYRLESVEKQLDESASGEEQGDLSIPPETPEFSVIKIDRLSYKYPEAGGQTGFALEVENFRLAKGELVIIKGGNGSGKSTFMRLLAGLYLPGSGEIMVNDTSASIMRGADYRSLFSIVFSDFHLFNDFYGIKTDDQELRYWAAKLGIIGFIKDYEHSHRLPSEALSSGQRKRMALLSAIMENRQILLLDEVPADFDPEFRNKYYRELIPELKSAGRTLILVSHDDRYFDIADRVIEFREGKIVS